MIHAAPVQYPAVRFISWAFTLCGEPLEYEAVTDIFIYYRLLNSAPTGQWDRVTCRNCNALVTLETLKEMDR